MIRPFLSGSAFLLAAACAGGPHPPAAVIDGDLRAELVTRSDSTPPDRPAGACWAHQMMPAVIETVSEQTIVSPAVTDAAGTVVTPASFRTVTRQSIVEDRRDVWFRTPCADQLTVAFVATLQRALKARGLYEAAVTGEMDAATRAAIRQFQAPQGLDSDVIALAAARQLGVAPTDLSDL